MVQKWEPRLVGSGFGLRPRTGFSSDSDVVIRLLVSDLISDTDVHVLETEEEEEQEVILVTAEELHVEIIGSEEVEVVMFEIFSFSCHLLRKCFL